MPLRKGHFANKALKSSSSLPSIPSSGFSAVVVGFGDLGCCVWLGLALSLVDSRYIADLLSLRFHRLLIFLMLLAFSKHLSLPWLGLYTSPSLPPSFLIATPQPPRGPPTSPPDSPTRKPHPANAHVVNEQYEFCFDRLLPFYVHRAVDVSVAYFVYETLKKQRRLCFFRLC